MRESSVATASTDSDSGSDGIAEGITFHSPSQDSASPDLTPLLCSALAFEMVIRIVVFAQWRPRMSLLRNSDVSVGLYQGLVFEAVACHGFAIQSHRDVRIVESQRDGMCKPRMPIRGYVAERNFRVATRRHV